MKKLMTYKLYLRYSGNGTVNTFISTILSMPRILKFYISLSADMFLTKVYTYTTHMNTGVFKSQH